MPGVSALMSGLTGGTAGLGVWKETQTGQDTPGLFFYH